MESVRLEVKGTTLKYGTLVNNTISYGDGGSKFWYCYQVYWN